MRVPRLEHPPQDQNHRQRPAEDEQQSLEIGIAEAVAETDGEYPDDGPYDPQAEKYAHERLVAARYVRIAMDRGRRRRHDLSIADHHPIQRNAVSSLGGTGSSYEKERKNHSGSHVNLLPSLVQPYNYDDSSVNGSIDPEFTDEEGPLWDVDAGFPDEPDEDDDEDEE